MVGMFNKARRSTLVGVGTLAGLFARHSTAALPVGNGQLELDDYAALRAYAGGASQIFVSGRGAAFGVAGLFLRDEADRASADDGGTLIVAAGGTRFKRVFSGPLSVTWFGARNDGSADADAAVALAQACCGPGRELFWPAGTYRLRRQLAITDGAFWHAGGTVTLSFSGLAPDMDCLRISGGAAYARTVLRDFIVDCGAEGRDGVVLRNGDHCVIRIHVKNARRDGFAVFCEDSDWVENADLDIYTEANGRHVMRIEMAGQAGAFFNESRLRLEGRGVSLRYDGGCGLLAVCAGSNAGSKVASLHIEAINLDAQRGAAAARGFEIGRNPIHLAYAADGTNKFEAWRIEGGGFETTTGKDDFRSPYLILADPGVKAAYWDIRGIVPFNWSSGQGVAGLTDYAFHSCKDSGGVATSGVAGGKSSMRTYAAAAAFDIDIPIPELPGNGNYGTAVASVLYELVLSYQRAASADHEMQVRRVDISFNKTGAGTYWVSSIVLASNIGAMIASINSLAVSGSNLRVNLTTGAGFGTGGDRHIHASLIRLAVSRA